MLGLLGGRRQAAGGVAVHLPAAPSRPAPCARIRAESQAADMSASRDQRATRTARGLRALVARLRALLPHGGSLPEEDWRSRHRVIGVLLGLNIIVVSVYAVAERGSAAIQYIAEPAAMLAFAVAGGMDRGVAQVALAVGLDGPAHRGGRARRHLRRPHRDALQLLRGDPRPHPLRGLGPVPARGGLRAHPPRGHGDDRPERGVRHARRPRAPMDVGRHPRAVRGPGGRRRRDRLGPERARPRPHARGPAPARAPRAHRLPDRPGQPPPAHGRRRAAPRCAAGRRRWRSSISTASRSTTTASATPRATRCSCASPSALRRTVAGTGSAYRLGGDEFCVLADGVDGERAGLRIWRSGPAASASAARASPSPHPAAWR